MQKLNPKIKSSRVGYSFIKRVLKLNVYWNIHFFSDQLLFFLLKKLIPPVYIFYKSVSKMVLQSSQCSFKDRFHMANQFETFSSQLTVF